MNLPPEWLSVTDAVVCVLLLPLAAWVILSGLDDLVVDVAAMLARLSSIWGARPSRRAVMRAAQSRIAIFIPCWQEHSVIGDMIERNHAHIGYENYDVFVGAYPNDETTAEVVCALTSRFARVHLAMCPHDGPTSKADCLNWIYQRMLLYEAENGLRFDVIVTHDAEDVVHPDALFWINWYSREYEMVQVPVLPLPTRPAEWVHGVYCDEFAEYQARDMPARQFMGAFVPSNGVGTGFKREALERLAQAQSNRIFEPVCLTEDYENGLRLRLVGARQIFVPMGGHGVATREYFPKTSRAAVRQRTRWVTGIALQTWERHGWTGTPVVKYWLWRDRKGLIGNPASLLTNLIFVYGAGTLLSAEVGRWPWGLRQATADLLPLLAATSVLGVYRLIYRATCVYVHFGFCFALLTPVRTVLANCINSAATANALLRFALSRAQGQPLRWVKTEHQYPGAAALLRDRRKLGQILVGGGYIAPHRLQAALSTKPEGRRLGEHLVALGWIDETALYEALSLQSGMPMTWLDPLDVPLRTARSLPAKVTRECRVIPFKVQDGRLCIAGPESPTVEVQQTVGRMTSLETKFWLVTPSNYARLVESLL